MRNRLFKQFYKLLKANEYPHLKAFLFGHLEDKVDGNITFVHSDGMTKGDKLTHAFNYLNENKIEADYISRLDDDDWLPTKVLFDYQSEKSDLICDEYHVFLDCLTGNTSYQKRFWVANTAFHRWEHGMKVINEENGTGLLFDYSHNDYWHPYYDGKSIRYSDKYNPLYVRILSPTSITSSESKRVSKSVQLNEKDLEDYISYLDTYGFFDRRKLPSGVLPVAGDFDEMRNDYALDDYNVVISKSLIDRFKHMIGMI